MDDSLARKYDYYVSKEKSEAENPISARERKLKRIKYKKIQARKRAAYKRQQLFRRKIFLSVSTVVLMIACILFISFYASMMKPV